MREVHKMRLLESTSTLSAGTRADLLVRAGQSTVISTLFNIPSPRPTIEIMLATAETKISVIVFVLCFCLPCPADCRYQLANVAPTGKTEIFDTYLFENTGNSSFGFSVPLFSVTVPGYGREHPQIDQFRTINFGNLALLGMTILGFASLVLPFFPRISLPFPLPLPWSSRKRRSVLDAEGPFSRITERLQWRLEKALKSLDSPLPKKR